MKQKHRIKLLIFLLIFSLTACKIQAPIIGEPTSYELEKLDLKEIKLKIWLPIENPNNIKFNISNVDMDIFVNGLKLGKVTKLEKVHIPKNSKDIYAIKLDVQIKDLGISAISAMRELKSRRVTIKLDGSVTVSKFVIVKKIEVEAEESIKI
ncbi:MAG: LEA type 2 family protein [Bacteroidales bacterium]|jgi:LEA14-like dessication related protein|nr:LEA type 2 family protein [Bacteroidales bacterium]